MAKRLITLAVIAAVVVSFSPLASFAGDTKPAATTPKAAAPASTTPAKNAATPKPTTQAASTPVNEIAVCGCGKVFTPTASTPYTTFEGKRYACCSEGCHKMAEGNPAAAAKMAEDNTAKAMAQLASSTPSTTTPASNASKPN
jgi:hypothetical protein